ncbi:MAG: ATP-binding protein [Acidobacteria bacterium]|nr:ATP-binding protein [Acidobacteriota bacterium]
MKQLYLMCGLAFAGKTTLGSALCERLGAGWISLDEINAGRGLHGGLGIPVAEWARTHRLALEQLAALAERGSPIVLDDTNCFRWLRDSYREIAAAHGYVTTVVLFDVPLALALERLRANDDDRARAPVREDILRELARTFEYPAQDERVVRLPAGEPLSAWLERCLR